MIFSAGWRPSFLEERAVGVEEEEGDFCRETAGIAVATKWRAS